MWPVGCGVAVVMQVSVYLTCNELMVSMLTSEHELHQMTRLATEQSPFNPHTATRRWLQIQGYNTRERTK